MSQLTKKAIIDCTFRLAERKPIKKIHIGDIVDECGITRNTFYYYFHDIYDVLDSAIEDEIRAVEEHHENYEQTIFSLIAFCASHKSVWQNVYRSIGHEQLSKFVNARLHRVILAEITHLAGDQMPDERDLYIITSFYEEALFGIMARWLRDDHTMPVTGEDLARSVERIRVIFTGNLKLAIDNCKNG